MWVKSWEMIVTMPGNNQHHSLDRKSSQKLLKVLCSEANIHTDHLKVNVEEERKRKKRTINGWRKRVKSSNCMNSDLSIGKVKWCRVLEQIYCSYTVVKRTPMQYWVWDYSVENISTLPSVQSLQSDQSNKKTLFLRTLQGHATQKTSGCVWFLLQQSP